jgi:hypothetical protein
MSAHIINPTTIGNSATSQMSLMTSLPWRHVITAADLREAAFGHVMRTEDD